MVNSKSTPHKKAKSKARISDNIPQIDGWKYVGHFGTYVIYRNDNKRRLIEPETGILISEYTVGVGGRISAEP